MNCTKNEFYKKKSLKFDADFKSPPNIKIPENLYILLFISI